MKCIYCGSRTEVHQTRNTRLGDTNATSRRHHCLVCKQRFSTYEVPREYLEKIKGQVDALAKQANHLVKFFPPGRK